MTQNERCGLTREMIEAGAGALAAMNDRPATDVVCLVFRAMATSGEWVAVPRKPTETMISAAWEWTLAEDASGVWSSMIEAAHLALKDGEIGKR